MLGLLFLTRRGVCFDCDIDLFALSEARFLPFVVCHNVVDANLLVEIIGAFNANLRLLGLVCARRLDDLFDDAG